MEPRTETQARRRRPVELPSGATWLTLFLSMALMWPMAASAQGPAQAPARLEVIASGLDNPRGIDVDRRGRIFVAQAGRGGNRCATFPPPEGGPPALQCVGNTGAVSRVWRGATKDVVTGLPSVAGPNGNVASGPNDVSLTGVGLPLWVSIGELGRAAPAALRDDRFQTLALVSQRGHLRIVADLGAYEEAYNPAGDTIQSNPYGVQALGRRALVADAGGNDLLRVSRRGRISTVAVFPGQLADAPPFLPVPPGTQLPSQSVPTAVVVGPDGAYYVGELTGFPFPRGKARIWRVVPGHTPELFATGFTNIIDLTFGRRGELYVLQHTRNGLLAPDQTGALIRLDPDGGRTEIASEGLVRPGGVAIGPTGSIYVTNKAIFAHDGQVVRVHPAH